MTNSKNSIILGIVFVIVFAINLLQSYYTELLPDEAYYWVYSQNLDWGYFDHPPMVVALIKISSMLFKGELGVRFMSSIIFLLTSFIFWKTVKSEQKNNIILFVSLFFSFSLINVYGFITTPDTPLILFTALFLYGYKCYLENKNLVNYFLIAIAAAGMLYSKYQSVVVFLCIIISNPKLLKDGKLWLSAFITLILFSPHLYWQWSNDFPSIKYHLIERVSNRRYKLEHTLMHIVNMIVVVGLTFPLVYKAFIKQIKSKETFTKGLVYIVFGFFLLFFFSSFRGRVQAQWLVPISFSLIVLSYHYYLNDKKSKKWLYSLAIANVLVLFVGRFAFANENFSPKKLDTHGNKSWAQQLKNKYPNTPKFFVNSYQNAASYWFYSKEQPYYYRNFTGRKNHFSLIQKDLKLDFNSVLFANRGRTKESEIAFPSVGKDSIYLEEISHFKKPSIINFDWSMNKNSVAISRNNEIKGTLSNISENEVFLDNFVFEVGFRHKKQGKTLTLPTQVSLNESTLEFDDKTSITIRFQIPKGIDTSDYNAIGIGIKSTQEIEVYRISEFRMFTFTP